MHSYDLKASLKSGADCGKLLSASHATPVYCGAAS